MVNNQLVYLAPVQLPAMDGKRGGSQSFVKLFETDLITQKVKTWLYYIWRAPELICYTIHAQSDDNRQPQYYELVLN